MSSSSIFICHPWNSALYILNDCSDVPSWICRREGLLEIALFQLEHIRMLEQMEV